MANPYDVERTWPEYFTRHRELTLDRQGTYRCGELPVWTIYCPKGYLGNSTVIEGDDGLIVYDTGVTRDAGEFIAAEIARISDKPIRAVFYSHHHADHYNGTAALVDPAEVEAGAVDVYAWRNFVDERANEFGAILDRQIMGVAYYAGALLPAEDRHHHGIGTMPAGGGAGYVPPTKLLDADTTLHIAGVRLEVFYTGGEAISEYGIHVPDLDMVIIADEFFTGLPNLHSIRGSRPRLPDNYVGALDRVLQIGPEWLLGSHIIPLQGRERIVEAVTRYRDATQYLWDQSVRLINKGYTPVELQHALRELPEEVVDPPYTVPSYGAPFTTVPEFYTGWVSWFTGDATDLFPSLPARRASRMVELMGGVEQVLGAARADHEAGEYQLAAELAQLALRAAPEHEDARLLKAAALRARGYQEVNPIARSWYLTGALELEGAFDPADVLAQMGAKFAAGGPPAEVVRNWRYKLDADAAVGRRLAVGMRFTDTGEELTVRVRHRVLVVEDGIDGDVDAVVEMTGEQLGSDGTYTTVSADEGAYATLLGLLDLEPTPFRMHMR